MKSISSWAASLEDKILGALWSLLQNMLIPIMSGLSAVLFIICIFQAISSYQSGDQVSTRRNIKNACICLFVAVCMLGIWIAIPKTTTIFRKLQVQVGHPHGKN